MYGYIESCPGKNAEQNKGRGSNRTEFHSCVLLTPELNQMKKMSFHYFGKSRQDRILNLVLIK